MAIYLFLGKYKFSLFPHLCESGSSMTNWVHDTYMHLMFLMFPDLKK